MEQREFVDALTARPMEIPATMRRGVLPILGKATAGRVSSFSPENDFRGGHRQAGQLETGSDTECEPEKEEFSNGESG